jgi:hypothetical protein
MAVCYLIGGLSTAPFWRFLRWPLRSISYYALQGPLLALATSFLHGKSAAAGIAAMNTIGILGGFIGPFGWVWPKTIPEPTSPAADARHPQPGCGGHHFHDAIASKSEGKRCITQ